MLCVKCLFQCFELSSDFQILNINIMVLFSSSIEECFMLSVLCSLSKKKKHLLLMDFMLAKYIM